MIFIWTSQNPFSLLLFSRSWIRDLKSTISSPSTVKGWHPGPHQHLLWDCCLTLPGVFIRSEGFFCQVSFLLIFQMLRTTVLGIQMCCCISSPSHHTSVETKSSVSLRNSAGPALGLPSPPPSPSHGRCSAYPQGCCTGCPHSCFPDFLLPVFQVSVSLPFLPAHRIHCFLPVQ